MSIKKRLSQAESMSAALEAARTLLIEQGPQAVTLKAVAARVKRTHANLLHHFGSAGGLQKALAQYLADRICTTIADAVIANRAGVGSSRAVVDLTFDAFDKEGAGALASWMLLSGNRDALDPIIDAIHDVVEELHDFGAAPMRDTTLALVLMALGDAQLGKLLSESLELPRHTARDMAEQMLVVSAERNLRQAV